MQPSFGAFASSPGIEQMKYKSLVHMNCSLAQTLEVIGERWTLMILRDAFFGARRFSQFQKSLGVPKNILTTRLTQLVDEGIMEKRPAADGAHQEYLLTERGYDLQPVLLSLMHWGDKHKPNPAGDRLVFVERSTGEPIRPMSAISQDGRPLASREIRATAGPGLDKAAQEQLERRDPR